MTIHNAPPVTFPVGRSRFQTQLLSAFWLAGLALTVGWACRLGAEGFLDWRPALGLLAVIVAGGAAWHAWRHMPTGVLAWDGLVWRWESGSYQTGIADYSLSVLADLQSRLVLRLENPAGAPLWLWVEKQAFPDRWPDLRRAVYSPDRSTPSVQATPWLAVEPAADRLAAASVSVRGTGRVQP